MLKLKKYMAYFSVMVILACAVFSSEVLANENLGGYEKSNDFDGVQDELVSEWKQEIIVELRSEEEFYTYKINPEYKYIFTWEIPSLARAVCYNCGKSTMGLIKKKEQYAGDDRMCPIAPASLYNDYFATWHTYTYERCTACGYVSEGFDLVKSYSAYCCNDDNPIDGSMWEVKAEYTIDDGYNPHQCLSWWLNYDLY